MGLLVDYNGGLDVEDYHLKYHGNGNGFQVFSNCHNGIINDSTTRVHKGVIELTMESIKLNNETEAVEGVYTQKDLDTLTIDLNKQLLKHDLLE